MKVFHAQNGFWHMIRITELELNRESYVCFTSRKVESREKGAYQPNVSPQNFPQAPSNDFPLIPCEKWVTCPPLAARKARK